MNNIEKIKKSGLVGRSGSCFPTGLKWELAKRENSIKNYVVCNASEGEMNTFKDYYILKNNLADVVNGIKIALETFSNSYGYIYINKDYYEELKDEIEKEIKDPPIEIFIRNGPYISGEETSLIEAIEGSKPEPRIKPPFPTQKGLWGFPTLVNNVETFYHISKIINDEYKNTRFYCISGDIEGEGVFEDDENISIKDLLEKTGNLPEKDFFVQLGGGTCGSIILPEELDIPFKGLASIVAYDREKTDPYDLMRKWADFLLIGNCDKCTPCREGLYRISELINSRDINKKVLDDIFHTMKRSSLCPLGRSAFIPFKTLIEKLELK